MQNRYTDLDSKAEHILNRLEPTVLRDLTVEQRSAIFDVLKQAMSAPSQRPRLVDIRFVVDLILTRFYVVLLVGKDRRQSARKVSRLTQAGNAILAALLLLCINLTISAMIILSLYLVKSALGIDLLPFHFAHYLQNI